MSCGIEDTLEQASSRELNVTSSTLAHVNSQLVAHGYLSPPGLKLDGIPNAELEHVSKCLLGMLSQRVEDMSRTEELTTKLRTLTYDHERLSSLHKTATEIAANAERDTNLHKSRFTTATRALQVSESAHKQTVAELQRTRTMLQGIRASHQAELKKRERDVERMSEKWSKIADAQAKHMAIPSGMRLANSAVTTGSEIIGKGTGFLEIALEEAERSRYQLSEENTTLRRLILTTVNEAQDILHQSRPLEMGNAEEPTPYTFTTLFPLHPPGNANQMLSTVLNKLRERLKTLALVQNPLPSTVAHSSSRSATDSELKRLRGIIEALQNELANSQKQAVTQAEETRAMFDKFAEENRIETRELGELSVELMSAPLCDAEKKRLDDIRSDLDQERQKFTEAAIKLGKDRAQLEHKAERNQLLDERRSWQVEKILAELPPTPEPFASSPRAVAAHGSPRRPPKKSPAKISVANNKRKKVARFSRGLVSPSKVIPSYETEFLPPPDDTNRPPVVSLLPTSFSLPPPSPHTSLPSHPVSLVSTFPPESQQVPQQSTTPPSPPSSPEATSFSTDPSTPTAHLRPFPVAKPFAQHMIHAYSPAKPSPLSRILMLGNSPDGTQNVNWASQDVSSLLEPIVEGDELITGFERPVMVTSAPPLAPPAQMSLAAELGLSEPPLESPLQEKKQETNMLKLPHTSTMGKVSHSDPKQVAAKLKNQSTAHILNGRVKTSAGTEKENSGTKTKRRAVSASARMSPSETTEDTKVVKQPKKSLSSVLVQRSTVRTVPPGNGGPRRVLIDSEEAPRVGKGWKG